MARLNKVRLFGIVAADPMIKYIDGEPKNATMYVVVASQNREIGLADEEMFFSKPMIYTMDPEIIHDMESLHQYDIVDIKGVFTVLNANRGSFCPHCGAKNVERSEVSFISPLAIDCRFSGQTSATAMEIIKQPKYRERSNEVELIGYLCDDVQARQESTIYTDIISRSAYRGITAYQLAVNRAYYLSADNPATRTDYPHILSVGTHAEMDAKCIYKGSLVMVDGMVVTRTFRKKGTCQSCQQDFDWPKTVTEVLTFGTEYLDNFRTPEQYAELQKQQAREQLEKLGFQVK